MHQRLEQQQRAKKKGISIQIPPLNIALIEVRQDLAKHTWAVKDMAMAYKNVEKVTDIL